MSIVPELKRNMTDMLRILLDNYRRDLLPFIVQHASEDTDYRSWLLLAAERDHQFVWKDILQYYEPVTNQLLDCIADYDAISIFKEYFIHRRLEVTSLDYYPSPGASFKRDSLSVCSLDADLEAVEIDKLDYILDRAISRRSSKVIAEIEKLLVVDWRRKLLACIDGYTVADRRKYTSVCLSKLDSDADLYSMLARATDRYVAIAILHDKRIRVEKLSVQEVQRLYRLVGTGTVRIAIESNDERISSYLSGTDTYSFVLRYLVFKSRDKESMLDWLITAELDSVALAAASTLDYTVVWNEAIDPLRALFTSLLYPSLSIREIVELMKEAGYSYEGLEKSITLLNLAM
ncbi:Hypothetical protein POVR2_LOCUS278 [uncultured virus]|nr:Hypothetical protein POVR2_LOCUS278 [uncultured virus]